MLARAHVCVVAAGKLAVLDVVEVNPEIGSAEDQARTLDACNAIVAGWFDGRALQR